MIWLYEKINDNKKNHKTTAISNCLFSTIFENPNEVFIQFLFAKIPRVPMQKHIIIY